MKKNLCILGSTGSVGSQALEVADELGIKVGAISGNSRVAFLESQVRKFKPEFAVAYDENNARELKIKVRDTSTKVLYGMEGLCEICQANGIDMVITAISGLNGLIPTLSAIDAGKTIGLANKETLVAGGKHVMKRAREKNVDIIPIDSEHSAIFQCLKASQNKKEIKKLILTASGGPFFQKPINELENVSIKETLAHPNWNMGAKITVDSATMINKGLELIEAMYLFDVPESKIDVIVHRESVVHSMVQYKDNSIIAQMAVPDMKIPIQYAMTYPERKNSKVKELNLCDYQNLSFYKPGAFASKSLKIARDAAVFGEVAMITLNCANEEAVDMFLNGKIRFTDILDVVQVCIDYFTNQNIKISCPEDILNLSYNIKNFIKSTYTNIV